MPEEQPGRRCLRTTAHRRKGEGALVDTHDASPSFVVGLDGWHPSRRLPRPSEALTPDARLVLVSARARRLLAQPLCTVAQGAGVNAYELTVCAHASGTHTESAAHATRSGRPTLVALDRYVRRTVEPRLALRLPRALAERFLTTPALRCACAGC